jgi:hypothetical protein
VLVSDGYGGGSGTYGLTANGIFDVLRLLSPVISGTNLTLKGIGGTTKTSFVLYSTTNITTPWGLWTPCSPTTLTSSECSITRTCIIRINRRSITASLCHRCLGGSEALELDTSSGLRPR